eukprot:PhF_6_TR35390/c1_g1_i3/m.51457
MVSNLEVFRPHLPEYVWQMVKQRHFNASNSSVSSDLDDASDQEMNTMDLIGEHTHSSDTLFVAPPTSFHTTFIFLSPQQASHTYFSLIEYRRKNTVQDLQDGFSSNSMVKPAALRLLVNWAHAYAVKTKGNLHSFVGDSIQASWTFQTPSAKPAIFLVRMYKTFNEDTMSGLHLFGALGSGVGTSYMAGDRRQAFLLHITWRDIVTKLHILARENTAALFDEATYRASHSHIVCRWVDNLENNNENMRIYEPIREI